MSKRAEAGGGGGLRLSYHTRAGCSLCEKAWPVAVELAERHGLALERVDIERDPALLRRHGERIPVLTLGETELGWGRLSARALERELGRALARERERSG